MFLVTDIETIADPALYSIDPAKPDAFPPTHAHRIITIGGMGIDDKLNIKWAAASTDPDERKIIASIARWCSEHKPELVTYNGRTFDLPVLVIRCLHHGIPLPFYYRDANYRKRYSERGHIDLMDSITDFGAGRGMPSLDVLSKLIGLPGKMDMNGTQVADLYRDGRIDDIRRYCLSDVAQSALLFFRFRYVQGLIAADGYRAVMEAALAWMRENEALAPMVEKIDRDRLLSVDGQASLA